MTPELLRKLDELEPQLNKLKPQLEELEQLGPCQQFEDLEPAIESLGLLEHSIESLGLLEHSIESLGPLETLIQQCERDLEQEEYCKGLQKSLQLIKLIKLLKLKLLKRFKNATEWESKFHFPSSTFIKLVHDLTVLGTNPVFQDYLLKAWKQDNDNKEQDNDNKVLHWKRFLIAFAWLVSGQGPIPLGGPIEVPQAELLHLFKEKSEPKQLRFFIISSMKFWLNEVGLQRLDSLDFWSNWKQGDAMGADNHSKNAICRYMELMDETISPNFTDGSLDKRMAGNFKAYQFLLERLKERDPKFVPANRWILKPEPASRNLPGLGWRRRPWHYLAGWTTGHAFTPFNKISAIQRVWLFVLLASWACIAAAAASVYWLANR